MNFNDFIAPIKRRINNLVARGITTVVNELGALQTLQARLMNGEILDDLERVGQYGLANIPPVGSEIVTLFHSGERSHPITIAVEDADARKAAMANVLAATGLAIQPEDVLVYTTNTGFVLLRAATGNIILHSPGTIRLDANRLELHADSSIKWDVNGRGYDYGPTQTNTFETCTIAGSSSACAPPEHGAKAQ